MKHALLVFIGGGVGSVARYLLGKWLNNLETAIPYGTMLSNVLGSLLIGIFLFRSIHFSLKNDKLFSNVETSFFKISKIRSRSCKNPTNFIMKII